MNKKLQKSLLGAGILPTNGVKEMEQWQNVPKGSADQIGKFSTAKVKALREDLELQNLPTLRETVLDVDKLVSNGREVVLTADGASLVVHVGVDVMGRYIFPIPTHRDQYQQLASMMRQTVTLLDDALPAPRNKRTIVEISVLYATVDEGEHEPTHWFCRADSAGEETVLRAR